MLVRDEVPRPPGELHPPNRSGISASEHLTQRPDQIGVGPAGLDRRRIVEVVGFKRPLPSRSRVLGRESGNHMSMKLGHLIAENQVVHALGSRHFQDGVAQPDQVDHEPDTRIRFEVVDRRDDRVGNQHAAPADRSGLSVSEDRPATREASEESRILTSTEGLHATHEKSAFKPVGGHHETPGGHPAGTRRRIHHSVPPLDSRAPPRYCVGMPGFTTILSPAKSLEMEAADIPADVDTTNPRFAGQTRELSEILSGFSPAKLASLMSISPKLAELNRARWEAFGSRGNPRGPAAMCFRGDVYQGLEAWTMSTRSRRWAQDHIRILSGLYGLLRPLDRIQPYRLEMGTRLKTRNDSDLYGFWGDRIMKTLRKDMAASKSETLVNLASDEYSKAARLPEIGVPVIDVKFLQIDSGKEKFISFHAKKARGLMARWMADHRPRTLEDLRGFNAEGYRCSSTGSDDTMVFTRPRPVA